MIITDSGASPRCENRVAVRYLIEDPTGVMDTIGAEIMSLCLPEFSFRLKGVLNSANGEELERTWITNGTPKERVTGTPLAISVVILLARSTSEENSEQNAKVSDLIRAVWHSMCTASDFRFLGGKLVVK